VANGQPLLNRAIQSVGPTGSTFKPITATAALQSGEWSTSQIFDDTGQFCVGSGGAQQCRHNSGHAVDGSLDLVNALKVSSDDFFYNLGARTNPNDPASHPNGGPLDQWAHKYGIGRDPGIDLPNAAKGTLPSPKWRASRNRLEAECDNATGPFKGKRKHSPGGCGIADGTNRPWSIGDNESLAVGQGDVQVSPLQLAVAYAALANGGTIVRPHLALDVQNTAGTVLQRIDPPPSRHININPLYLETIRAGLRAAASQPGGTSDDVMGNFHQQVYGKTGTAQYFTANTGVESDYAWYACFVPATATSKPIVVVVWVEKGGFGDVGAAPVARQILSQWFYGKAGPYVTGTSTSL
jgi:penicillin-binding protein 2